MIILITDFKNNQFMYHLAISPQKQQENNEQNKLKSKQKHSWLKFTCLERTNQNKNPYKIPKTKWNKINFQHKRKYEKIRKNGVVYIFLKNFLQNYE